VLNGAGRDYRTSQDTYPANHSQLGFVNGQPVIIAISGHFSSGKDTLYNEMPMHLSRNNCPVTGVLNYKGRDPRGNEIVGRNYLKINSDRHYRKLIESGDIVVPYSHDGRPYGLSGKIFEVLKKSEVPLVITDAEGLHNLASYLRSNRIQNKLVSFLLHTSKTDAKNRLIHRLGPTPSQQEIEALQTHWKQQEGEFELYMANEDLFRHIFRNGNAEDVNYHTAMAHLSNRAMDILNLENILNAESSQQFREGFANEAVTRLFGIPIKDLNQILSEGKNVFIIGDSPIKAKVLGSSSAYGVLSVYLEPIEDASQKKILVEAIERQASLTPQYVEKEIKPASESAIGLKQASPQYSGLIDFLISFSSYDPMRVPRIDAPVHTVAIESLWLNRNPNTLPVTEARAKKLIEGNGTS